MTAKLTIEEMHRIARERGGKCLSRKYVDRNTNLKWRCKEGHVWYATPGHIKHSGSWCPKCSEGISERICRKFFEIIFNEKFPNTRLKWLMSPKGRPMELDGYCRKLGLAFEYQGRQHYVDVDAFRKKSNLEERKKYDRLKRDLCVCNNVKLIVIPYTVQYEGIQGYILKECKEQGIDVPRITSIIDYRLFNVYSPEELRKLQHLAKSKGGMCLSKRYINSSTKLRWQCKKGHQWKTTPSNITNGAWCPHCYGHLTLAIGDMQRLAKEKGGKCLSTEYINSQTKLKWQCKKGHTWEAISTSIKNGNHWCPYCVGLARRTIEDMQNMAEQKGGECLSREYINSKVRLKWKCKEGHIWEATPNAIQRNQWCPHCAGTRKLSIEDMHKLAKNRGGECLSTEYINSKTKLKWQCKEGHRWWAKSNDIQTGYWCPYCAGSVKHTIEDMQRLAKKKKAVCLSTKYVNNKGSSLIFGG